MFDEMVNLRAQHYLRSLIDSLPYDERVRLKTLRYCNTDAAAAGENRVYLLRSDKGHTSFFGLQTCKNTWVCPHCAAIQMKKYRERIAAAIDLLKKQDLVGVMITFTLPHFKAQSCKEVTKVLYDSFGDCIKNAYKNRECSNGSFRSCGTFNSFFHECEIKHYVRVCEHTFSKINGWHPHFHCLFWLPKRNLQKVLQWEEKIKAAWNQRIEKQYKKYWEKNGWSLSKKAQNNLVALLYREDADTSVFISKDSNGNARIADSAAYLTGWTSDVEMTGLHLKTANKVRGKHYTPQELLELAMNGDKDAEKTFIDYLLTVTQKPVHHRVKFSRTGICAAVKIYMQQEKLNSVVKKKQDESQEEWAIFAWFTREEWFKISQSDRHTNAIENIAYLCSINRKDLLTEFLLEVFDMRLHDDITPIGLMIQEQFYNKVA